MRQTQTSSYVSHQNACYMKANASILEKEPTWFKYVETKTNVLQGMITQLVKKLPLLQEKLQMIEGTLL